MEENNAKNEWQDLLHLKSIPLGPRETKMFSTEYKSGCDLMSIRIVVCLQLYSAVITYCHYKTNIQ